MADETALDTPIIRATIDQLPIEVLDNWLAEVRIRRLAIVNKIKAVKEVKRTAYINDIKAKYITQYARIESSLKKVEEHLDMAEKHLHKLRAMQLEMEDDDVEGQGDTAIVPAV